MSTDKSPRPTPAMARRDLRKDDWWRSKFIVPSPAQCAIARQRALQKRNRK